MSERNRASFEEAIQPYEKLIYNIAYRYFNNPDDARDMAQEALLKAWRGFDGFRGDGLKSWLCAICANTCLDELRKRKSRPVSQPEESDQPALERIPSGEPTPERAYIEKERREAVLSAIGKLPEDQRTLVILRDLQGLPYEELADATGEKLGTVKSKLSRARNKLKQIITEQNEI